MGDVNISSGNYHNYHDYCCNDIFKGNLKITILAYLCKRLLLQVGVLCPILSEDYPTNIVMNMIIEITNHWGVSLSVVEITNFVEPCCVLCEIT